MSILRGSQKFSLFRVGLLSGELGSLALRCAVRLELALGQLYCRASLTVSNSAKSSSSPVIFSGWITGRV